MLHSFAHYHITVASRALILLYLFCPWMQLHETLVNKLSKLPAAFPVAKSMFGGESVKRERVDKLQQYFVASCLSSTMRSSKELANRM